MKKGAQKKINVKLWARRFILAVSAVFLYWINENFIGLSIHNPTCLIIISYFFISLSLIDILICKVMKMKY